MDREPVDKITADQHALISAAQFLGVTGSMAALKWAMKDGWLERYRRHRGLYIVAGAPRTPYQPIMGACLLAGPNGAASHFSGAWLFEAPDIAECEPELTIFQASHWKIPGATLHRSGLAPEGRIVFRHGIPTVNASMVVVQLAQAGATYLAQKVANNFLKRGLTHPAAILELLEEAGPRRRGAAALRAWCLRALKVPGHDDSPAARDLGAALLIAAVPPFVTQHHVCVEGHDYFLDFAWPEQMVGLEYNGWADHGTTRAAFDSDAMRRSRLTAAGWRILDATSVASHDDVIRWVFASLGASGLST